MVRCRTKPADNNCLRADAWRLAQCDPDRHHACDGDTAGGTARHSHDFPGTGRMADREESRVDATRAHTRDAGLGHRALCRQDRHAYPKPDDARRTAHSRRGARCSGNSRCRVAGAFSRAPRVCNACEPARSIRSDGQGDQGGHRYGFLPAPNTFIRTGRSSTSIRFRQSCSPSRGYGAHPTGATM